MDVSVWSPPWKSPSESPSLWSVVRGDPGVASITQQNTEAPTKEKLASLYASNVLHTYLSQWFIYMIHIPRVGYYVCKTGTYHCAKLFYRTNSSGYSGLTQTQAKFKQHDCDSIIKLVGTLQSGKTHIGYESWKNQRSPPTDFLPDFRKSVMKIA